MRILSVRSLVAITFISVPPHVASQTSLTCSSNSFQSPNYPGAYPGSLNEITTICPNNQGESVSVTFEVFDLEDFCSSETFCQCFDGLAIYDSDVVDPLVLIPPPGATGAEIRWCWEESDIDEDGILGTGDLDAAGAITSSHSSGCLTFVFTSDFSLNNLGGFSATISCLGEEEEEEGPSVSLFGPEFLLLGLFSLFTIVSLIVVALTAFSAS